MSGIGEPAEQRIEVGVEVRKCAHRRERFADAPPPPFPLEASKLVMPMPGPESQAGRGAESAAKTDADGILRCVEAELAREPGVGACDWLAGLEQSAGGVEEYGADQEMLSL